MPRLCHSLAHPVKGRFMSSWGLADVCHFCAALTVQKKEEADKQVASRVHDIS